MATVPPPQQTGTSQQKPTVAGIKIRTRKRAVVVKFEPESFRDQFLDLIPDLVDQPDHDTVPDETASLENFVDELEANEAKLDIKRYAEQFNEMFLVGGLVAPGGVIQYGERPNPFSVFASTNKKQIKARVDVLTKLARRLKYLPRMLEETLSHLLQYINKFGENTDKLAFGVGILIANGTLPLVVLGSTIKDHLVQEGWSLRFMTEVLNAYLQEHSMEALSSAIIKSGMDAKMPEFFPSDKRELDAISAHLTEAGLQGVADVLLKQRRQAAKNQMRDKLCELFGGRPAKSVSGDSNGDLDKDDDQADEADAASNAVAALSVSDGNGPTKAQQTAVVSFVREKVAQNKMSEADAIGVVWEALMASADFGTRADQAEALVLKTTSAWAAVLCVFCTTPRAEIALLTRVQTFCYETSALIKHFRAVVQCLYKHDVVSESAVLYWFERGALPQGKTVFLKQMEPFVKWLREADDDDDEE